MEDTGDAVFGRTGEDPGVIKRIDRSGIRRIQVDVRDLSKCDRVDRRICVRRERFFNDRSEQLPRDGAGPEGGRFVIEAVGGKRTPGVDIDLIPRRGLLKFAAAAVVDIMQAAGDRQRLRGSDIAGRRKLPRALSLHQAIFAHGLYAACIPGRAGNIGKPGIDRLLLKILQPGVRRKHRHAQRNEHDNRKKHTDELFHRNPPVRW